MGLLGWAKGKLIEREVRGLAKGKGAGVLKKIDGLKRVIVILVYAVEGFFQAMGWGEHTAFIGPVLKGLDWDPSGMGITPGQLGIYVQAGMTVWAVADGIVKWWRDRKGRDGVVERRGDDTARAQA